MEREPARYIVACCTPGCVWTQEFANRVEARQAGQAHEKGHESHITAIFPLDEVSMAA
jgi:hypothetical protein